MVEVGLALVQIAAIGSAFYGLLHYLNSLPGVLGCKSYLYINDVCIKGVPFLSVVLSSSWQA